MTLYVILLAGLVLWIGSLWLRGFFGSDTPAIERKIYWIRNGIWFLSMLIVSIPLRQHRDQLGTPGYIALAIAILAAFYWLGIVAARALRRRQTDA